MVLASERLIDHLPFFIVSGTSFNLSCVLIERWDSLQFSREVVVDVNNQRSIFQMAVSVV